MAKPSTLSRDISPPQRSRKAAKVSISTETEGVVRRSTDEDINTSKDLDSNARPTLAAIESGQAQIRDHLEYFTNHLSSKRHPTNTPALDIETFQALYRRNQHKHGRHFVVHQHDHPISGVHYDLRLQFSDSSTISFAIPYGLPGNPNSVRPNRMAVETRVHTLWNNLIETASHATGSLLIWDTGEYEILPWKQRTNTKPSTDDDDDERELSNDGGDSSRSRFTSSSQSERLFSSFQRKRIRLRLHGTKLPPNYTISMWLPSSNDRNRQPKRPVRKRRRVDPSKERQRLVTPSDSENEGDGEKDNQTDDQADPRVNGNGEANDAGLASDNDEDEAIRANNAYPGAENTIGSIHQRNWILTLDKRNSGFRRARNEFNVSKWSGDWETFFVRGRDYERSVVTGRNADEVMEDDGVEKFVGRKMWRAILE